MKFKNLVLSGVAVASLASCQLKSIGYINDSTSVDQMADASKNFKSAQACAYAPFFFYPPVYDYKDTISIAKAAKDAGIKKIAFIENQSTSYVLFSKYCMTAFGN